jgi:hypothetical protein
MISSTKNIPAQTRVWLALAWFSLVATVNSLFGGAEWQWRLSVRYRQKPAAAGGPSASSVERRRAGSIAG